MELDDRALPLTRGQLDIWLAQELGHSGAEWQLGLFVRINGTVVRDPLERAIRQVVQEAEPLRAAFFEVNGRVFQRVIDYPDVELAFYDLSGSRDPEQEARGIASSIQRLLMPFTGPLFKFALFRTRPDEHYWFACCHHIITDGTGLALVGRRIAAIYSAIVSDRPTPPCLFRLAGGPGQQRVELRSVHRLSGRSGLLEREISTWDRYRVISCPKPRATGKRIGRLSRFNWTRPSSAESKIYPKGWASVDHRSSPRRAPYWCVGSTLTVQKSCSTSRSAGECIHRQSCFPGWLPVLCRCY